MDIFDACEELTYENIDNESCNNNDTDKTTSSLRMSRDIDILVNGVWIPVINILSEKFPGMFSVGIANTFSRCYLSVHSFISALCDMVESLSQFKDQGKGKDLVKRIHNHKETRQFNEKWKFSLYLQVSVYAILV